MFCQSCVGGELFFFSLQLDRAVVSLSGMALTLSMIQAEDQLLMLMISVTRVDFRAQLWPLRWQIPENMLAHASHHSALPSGEASTLLWPTLIVLSLSNRWWGSPGCRMCRWPLFRDSVQDLGRAGWRHARTTSELSYHWHQVGWRCHVFILWEFNSPFRKDQSLCRCREAEQISAAGHTSFWACQENWGVSRVLQRMITNQYTATTSWIFIYNAGILLIKKTQFHKYVKCI